MKLIIVYGTTEGHTRDLSDFAAAALREAGHEALAVEATEDPLNFSLVGYDAAIVAASLHVGRYQPAVLDFVRAHKQELARIPSAFVSVSLSAAGQNPDDWEGLGSCVARFEQETGWRPRALHHAAGAIRYSQYDFFKSLALKFIARRRGKDTVTSHDYDLIDYEALKGFVLDFAAGAATERSRSTATA